MSYPVRLSIRVLLVLLVTMVNHFGFGQIQDYNYKRALVGVSDVWHQVVLPDDIFDKVSPGLSDLRIYGITESNDTIEAPYILRLNEDIISARQVDFNLINSTHNAKGYYYTFEVTTANDVNQVLLDFQESNFDRYVSLEGSQDQKEWFTIVEEARILSIKNNQTQYTFNTLSFPAVRYHYLRLFVPAGGSAPVLNSAKITEEKFTPGNYTTHAIEKVEIADQDDKKQTVVQLDLGNTVSVSQVKINVADKHDFYRPVSIQYLHDSTKTPKGWKENYREAYSGTLSSLEKNEYKFRSVITSKLKILISNHDNNPLKLDDFVVRGNVYELDVRFTEPASYMLVYGNNHATAPSYDIVNFTNKIPASISPVELAPEEVITKGQVKSTNPLFENKAWLWGIMGLIIFILGWFSVHMIRK